MGLFADTLNCAFPWLVAESADGQEQGISALSECSARTHPQGRDTSGAGSFEIELPCGILCACDPTAWSDLLPEKPSAS